MSGCGGAINGRSGATPSDPLQKAVMVLDNQLYDLVLPLHTVLYCTNRVIRSLFCAAAAFFI